MNEKRTVKIIGNVEGFSYGVIETSCYPNAFYGGKLMRNPDGWINAYNDTHLFHRSLDEAIISTEREMEKHQKEYTEFRQRFCLV